MAFYGIQRNRLPSPSSLVSFRVPLNTFLQRWIGSIIPTTCSLIHLFKLYYTWRGSTMGGPVSRALGHGETLANVSSILKLIDVSCGVRVCKGTYIICNNAESNFDTVNNWPGKNPIFSPPTLSFTTVHIDKYTAARSRHAPELCSSQIWPIYPSAAEPATWLANHLLGIARISGKETTIQYLFSYYIPKPHFVMLEAVVLADLFHLVQLYVQLVELSEK